MWPAPMFSWRSLWAPDHVLGVVGVDQLQPALADRVHQQRRASGACRRAGQVVAGREDVAGVQADAQLRVGVQRLEVRAEVPGPGAERGALAGGRLQQQERVVVVGQLVEQRQQVLAHLLQRRPPRSRPPVALPVCTTTPSAPISRPAAQRVPQRLHRPLHGRLGVRAEVDQVRGVDVRRDRAAAHGRAERLVLRGVARRAWPSRAGWRRRPARSRRRSSRAYARPTVCETAGHGDMAADGIARRGRTMGLRMLTRSGCRCPAGPAGHRMRDRDRRPLGAPCRRPPPTASSPCRRRARAARGPPRPRSPPSSRSASRRRRSSPVTSGTSTISGPLDSVSVTVSPSAAWPPGRASAGRPCPCRTRS